MKTSRHRFSTIAATISLFFLLFTRSSEAAEITGELKQWHKVTLTFDGPPAHETNNAQNPFRDYRFTVQFKHSSGSPVYQVPGYFAADGNAGETSAESGNKWRAHLAPDKPGKWTWQASFEEGQNVAITNSPARPVAPIHGAEGSFEIAPSDKGGRDFRGKGRLEYVGQRYLQFAGSHEYFVKAGADAPENLLAFGDFDGTWSHKKRPANAGEAAPTGLHRYEPHAGDWRAGDPTWKNGKGKNLIGALNYLASKGCNAFSFLTYNVGGDGDDVWPFVGPEDKFHFDCSKLDQWQIVFDHAQRLGLYLHFKLEETENDDNRMGGSGKTSFVPAALDQGDLGPERKLYLRELIARFGYELALNWNLGEENTQTTEQQRAMAEYIRKTDPYPHNIVVHTYPDWQDRVYRPLLGPMSPLTGASLQNGWNAAHHRVLQWVSESTAAGRPWVVANDEQNGADTGVPPDPGYRGFNGKAPIGKSGKSYDLNDIRKLTLWGTLMAGGAGVEYYFGYTLPENDLNCENWRARDRSWEYCRIALEFFATVPFAEMSNADELVGNPRHDNSRFCFAKPGEIYLVYLPQGGSCELDLAKAEGRFSVEWFNPREGGQSRKGRQTEAAGSAVTLGEPPSDPREDWLAIVRRR